MENLLDVAKYIYDKVPACSDKKVQKLTYYAYCWYLVINNLDENNINTRLFEEHPEAWIHGPVFYNLYDEMTYRREDFYRRTINLREETVNFLDNIISLYGEFTGNQLEVMTHSERPWLNAREGILPRERSRMLLDDRVIYNFYNNR